MKDPVEIFLDHLGGLTLLVLKDTGVTYTQQCGGMDCHARKAEGYLVPVNPVVWGLDGDPLTTVRGTQLVDLLTGAIPRYPESPEKNFDRLKKLLLEIEFHGPARQWHGAALGHLEFDAQRSSETLEAWVPILSPHGLAYLLWDNSD